MRVEAAKYIKLPSTKDGTSVPDVAILEKKDGNADHGKEIFKKPLARTMPAILMSRDGFILPGKDLIFFTRLMAILILFIMVPLA